MMESVNNNYCLLCKTTEGELIEHLYFSFDKDGNPEKVIVKKHCSKCEEWIKLFDEDSD
jgi:hypothetical protein